MSVKIIEEIYGRHFFQDFIGSLLETWMIFQMAETVLDISVHGTVGDGVQGLAQLGTSATLELYSPDLGW